MRTIDGFQDLKPPTDYADPNWAVDVYLDEDDRRVSLVPLTLVVGALQLLIGIAIGWWLGGAA